MLKLRVDRLTYVGEANRAERVPENAERALYFVRQVLSAVGATVEERKKTIRRLLDDHKVSGQSAD